MALYHLSVKPVSRGGGQSAVACAAYRTAEELRDERQGVTHDYQRKRGVEATMLLVPGEAGELLTMEGTGWTAERERLWNAAEAAEKRKDARVGREYEVALPCELDAAGRLRLVRLFGHELVERYGVAVDAAIHAPGREGDGRNWHAHVLTTTRKATPEGLGEKAEIELSDSARARLGLGRAADEIEGVRALWGGLVNQALEQARVSERVDHRSYERQGLGHLTPMQHAGPAVSNMERVAERKRVRERVPEAVSGPEVAWATSVTASVPAPAPAADQGTREVVVVGRPGEVSRPDRAKPQESDKFTPEAEGKSVAATTGAMVVAAPEPTRDRQAARPGPGRARGSAEGGNADWPVPTTGPGPKGPVWTAAGVFGAGPEPVTRVGRRNAEIQARNRAVAAARTALERAQRVVRELERAAVAGVRWVRGLARGLGAQAAEAREQAAERQRQERARMEAERRAEQEREARARQAAELRQRYEAERALQRPEVTQAQRDAARARVHRRAWGEAEEAGEAARRQQQQAAEREGQRHGPSLGM